MIRIASLMLGIAAMGVVGTAGYMSNVTLTHLLVRGILAFFIFYFTGTVVGVIVVKSLMDGLEKKRARLHAESHQAQSKPQPAPAPESAQ